MSAGFGITFVDLDETLFHTFAKIKVVKFGKLIRELSNKEFNEYKLAQGESFDFSSFRDAKFFRDTSEPLPQVIARIAKMVRRIKETSSDSRIIVLTARKDFDDKKTFLSVFRDHGLMVDDKDVLYVERSDNSKEGSIAEKKQRIMLKYLNSGRFSRCRMIDDNEHNLRLFLELKSLFLHIDFFALHVSDNAMLNRFTTD